MSRPHLAIVHNMSVVSAPVSFAEKLADHEAILTAYLDTHVTRNHSELTIESERRFLKGWFENLIIEDNSHPLGERQLLIWEAMSPITGRQRIVEFGKALVNADLKVRTVQGYLGKLRRLFEYVLDCPYVPGDNAQFLLSKYGRIEQPVLEYDYPVHVLDSDEEGFVLSGENLVEFYEFIRTTYISNNQKKLPASRDYTMIVLAGESGLRASEILHLDALKPHRDLFYQQNSIQTRFGKAAKGSGKRVRKTIFTPFAQATMRVYEERIRPNFPCSNQNPALFLSESGERISYQTMWRNLHVIAYSAAKAGLELPQHLSWHSLRRSFATNFMEKQPDKVWVLMDLMGHLNPSTLHRYVRHSRSYYEKAIEGIVGSLCSKTS